MLLAGGQGSRLGVLTANVAKPAVAFGGKYRIIDFPLSNCINSGIDTVGVLTQYRHLRLNTHIGIGIPWDLDRSYGGVTLLPPYESNENSDWYSGTANAIFQNMEYIESYNPEYVLILGGDHIYKMDYEVMLDFHKSRNADITIACMPVPWEEASRFGVVVADEEGHIREFEEKPEKPSSNLASMGIYIFNWDVLRKYLIEDEEDPESENDFGNNIIPNLLRDGRDMYAYHFSGYWKDVGTISSLWEANMEVLDPKNSGIDLFDEDWKIYSRNSGMTGHKIGSDAVIKNSMITDGCRIDGEVEHSVLFAGVKVAPGAVVKDAVVMGGTVIKPGAVVEHCIIGENAVIGENAKIGVEKEGEDKGVATIGPGVYVGDGATVGSNAMVRENVKDGEEEW